MKAVPADRENVSPSLGLEGSRAVGEKQTLRRAGQVPLATQRIDVQALNGGAQARVSKHNPPAAQRQNPQPPSPARLPGAALTPARDNRQPIKPPASQPVAQPKAHSRRATKAIFALLAVAVLIALA